jgi:hypothetical protein
MHVLPIAINLRGRLLERFWFLSTSFVETLLKQHSVKSKLNITARSIAESLRIVAERQPQIRIERVEPAVTKASMLLGKHPVQIRGVRHQNIRQLRQINAILDVQNLILSARLGIHAKQTHRQLWRLDNRDLVAS